MRELNMNTLHDRSIRSSLHIRKSQALNYTQKSAAARAAPDARIRADQHLAKLFARSVRASNTSPAGAPLHIT